MKKMAAVAFVLILMFSVAAHEDHNDTTLNHEDHSGLTADLFSAFEEPVSAGVILFTSLIGLTSLYMFFRNLREVVRSG